MGVSQGPTWGILCLSVPLPGCLAGMMVVLRGGVPVSGCPCAGQWGVPMSQDLVQMCDMEVPHGVTPVPGIGATGLTHCRRAGRRQGWP